MEILPKCINQNRALRICVDDECEHPNPFICGNCLCMQLHKNCIFPEWTNIKNKIEQSNKSNHPEFIKLSSAVEQTIQKSIKHLQKQLQYFNVWKSTFGMPTDAANLLKSIQNNQEHKLTGKQVAQILKDTKTAKEIKKYNEANIKQQMKKVLKQMENIQMMIREMYLVQEFPEEKIQKMKINKIPQVAIQNVPQLSLKIKQLHINGLNNRLIHLSEKPTDLELKCNRINILVQVAYILRKQVAYIFRKYILISFQTVHFNIILVVIIRQLISVQLNIILAVVNNQLIRVQINIISDVIINQLLFRSQLLDQLLVYISISPQTVHFNNILGVINNQLISVNVNIYSERIFQYHFRLYIQYHLGRTFKYHFRKYIQYHSDLKHCITMSIYLVALLSLKNPYLKSLKTLTWYVPYILGENWNYINCERLISTSLLSLPELQTVTIIAHGIASLEGFKDLGNKLKATKDEGWYNKQEW